MLRRKKALRSIAIVGATLWPLPLLGQSEAPPSAPSETSSAAAGSSAPATEPAASGSAAPARSSNLPAGLPTTRRDYTKTDNPWDTSVPSGKAKAAPAAEKADTADSAAEPDSSAGGEESASQESSSSPIRIYGFSDFTLRYMSVPSTSAWNSVLPRHPSFQIGNLNVYIDSQLAEKWRALTEVRFTYLPDGAPDTNFSDGLIQRESSMYSDYVELARKSSVGGIIIERAYLQYSAFPWLSVKAGQWLTPYGIWNVDHGSPTVISARSPFIIGSELFPRRQVGLLAEGTVDLGRDFELAYGIGVSNGRTNDFSFYEDHDANKAVTLRSAMTYRGLGELTIGATAYTGRATRAAEALSFGAKATSTPRIEKQWDEVTYGADLKWVWSGLHFQAEWVTNDRKYTAEGRTLAATGGLSPNQRLWGAYGLLGYRTPWFGIMPYGKLEYSPEPQAQALGIADKLLIFVGGFNIRPIPRVVFKIEYTRASAPGSESVLFKGQTIRGMDFQAAWAF